MWLQIQLQMQIVAKRCKCKDGNPIALREKKRALLRVVSSQLIIMQAFTRRTQRQGSPSSSATTMTATIDAKLYDRAYIRKVRYTNNRLHVYGDIAAMQLETSQTVICTELCLLNFLERHVIHWELTAWLGERESRIDSLILTCGCRNI